MNTFCKRRAALEDERGQRLSTWRISILLDCSERHVRHLMSWPDDEVRPAYVLALEYAREMGVDACIHLIETRPDALRRLLDDVTLSRTAVARKLGIDRSTLYRYTQRDRDAGVPRHHHLALLFLHLHYARGAMPADVADHIQFFNEAQ